MMKTLFLQAPSFDGFDGGAGARYQARREIQSFWYPTWLAQPAALVEGSKLIDAPPHRLKFQDIAADAAKHELVVLHTSTPSFASDVKTAEALKALNPGLKIGMIGAKVAVEPDATLAASGCHRFRRPQRVRFHHQGRGRGPRSRPHCRAVLAQCRRRHRAQRGPRRPREHGRTAFRHAGLQARPRRRELFHRLSEAPLYLVLQRPRLQVALHVLSLAADDRRPPLSYPQRRPRDRRARVGAEGISTGEGILLRRRHADGQHTARRSACARDRKARDRLVVQCQSQCAAGDLEDTEGQWPAAPAGRLRIRQPADPSQHQERHARRRCQTIRQGLPRARHRHPRYLHPRPPRRDQGDDRGNHPLRDRDQSAHPAGFTGGALSRNFPLQAGAGKQLVRARECGHADATAACSSRP